MDLSSRFERIYIDHSSLGSATADRAMRIFPREKIEFVSEKPIPETGGLLSAKEFERSKRLLYITKFKGSFFKQCPGSKGTACCNYFVLNLGHQCDMNCSYCYLQSYINTPLLTIYSNLDDAIEELRALAKEHANLPYRVGTGETTDSLSLDELTLYSRDLIEFFREIPEWTLEFKTKSAKVDQFIDLKPAGNVITSWSINPQYVIEREEHLTASLADRLQAAEKCLAAGFRLAFHIDPMLWHPEWKESYTSLIDEVTKRFQPSDVPTITLGALRYQPEQKLMMRERFGMKSLVTSAETFVSKDGKLRYDHSLRNEMFTFMIEEFKARNSAWNVWLCMETVESWVTTLKASPRKVQEAAPYFAPLRGPKKVESTPIHP